MSEEMNICKVCGSRSKDSEWCDHCGAPLSGSPQDDVAEWPEVGTRLELERADGDAIELRLDGVREQFSTRRVYAATLGEGDDAEAVVLIDERTEETPPEFHVPDALAHLVRVPIARARRGGHLLKVYPDTDGLTLEDLVDISNGQLTYKQVKKTFLAVLDAVIETHRKDHLILGLAPWTVRIEGEELQFRGAGDTEPGTMPPEEPVTSLSAETEADFDAAAMGLEEETDPDEGDVVPALADEVATRREEGDGEAETDEATPADGDDTPDSEAAPETKADDESDDESDDGIDDVSDADETPPDLDEEEPETGETADTSEGETETDDEEGEPFTVDAEADEAPSESSRPDEESADAVESEASSQDESDDAAPSADDDDEVDEVDAGGEASQGEVDSSADSDASEESPERLEESLDSEREISDLDVFEDEDGDEEPDEWSSEAEETSDGEEVDAFDDTNILTSPPVDPPEETRALFEEIDCLYPVSGDPERVPVVMGFSPPELLGRVRADLGPWCDVFGLGMLLYYLISGEVPPGSVYTRYSPAIPSRNFRPGFPPGLQPVIARATRPAPTDRYPDVRAMKDAFLNACALMEKRASHIGGDSAPRVQLAVDTHIGIAKRQRNPTNQDAVFGKTSEDGRFALIVVADGVSTASYGAGDLASHFLTAEAEKAWQEILPAYLMDERIDEVEIIGDILDSANERIVTYVNENHRPFRGNPHEVMGTTCLVAVVRDGIVTLATLGDSRVYIQNSYGLEQVTVDHNLWTLSILDGVSADTALAMPHGDALARCLGTFVIEEQQLTPVSPEPDFFRFALTRGDTLLLTTDGLIDFAGANPYAAEENVHAVMLGEPDPALACLELILLANRGGGGDNIGVGIAQFN